MRQTLGQSLDASKKIKNLLLLVAILYVASFTTGYLMISSRTPSAVELKDAVIESVLTEQPFTTVTEALKGGNLALAILLAYAVNLVGGAFLTTTLPGAAPLIGGLVTVAVTVFRGFTLGVAYYDVFKVPGAASVALGTAILELGAYVFSGAAGVNMSIATVFPGRYGVDSRWEAFKEAWRDVGRIFVIVAILLALGAVWEMTGMFFLIHPIT
ncbi:MAG: stage II sporulation protein M [Candidatus Geothermarchaeales archaeon]